MKRVHEQQVDVVIVGAGPVGLMLAIELKLGGAGVIVLERLTAPNLGIKSPSVGPLGAEALQRRGMGPGTSRAWSTHTAGIASCSPVMRRTSIRLWAARD